MQNFMIVNEQKPETELEEVLKLNEGKN